MNQITVKQLFHLCAQEIANGNRDKMIVVGDDNEGNGYHGLFYGFTHDTKEFVDEIYDSVSVDPEEIIILG